MFIINTIGAMILVHPMEPRGQFFFVDFIMLERFFGWFKARTRGIKKH